MNPPCPRCVSSTRSSVLISWSPEAAVTALSSRCSSSSLLQKSPRHSRTALLKEEDRKVSRTCLASTDCSIGGRSLLKTPPESHEEPVLVSEDSEADIWQTDEWYTLQRKDRLLGWTTVYWGYKNKVDVKSLAPGDFYLFRVNASTDVGSSEWSEVLTVTTKDDLVSAASLHRALDNGNLSSVRKVLAARQETIEMPNKMGRVALAIATVNGDSIMASMLLSSGADANPKEAGSYRTPLMTAAFRGASNLINVLKERDASWEVTDRKVRFGQTALHYATMNSKLNAVQIALKEAKDVIAKDKYGWTPLMQAVTMRASTEVVESLIKNGCDVNVSDKQKQTILMQAVLVAQPEIIELLLKYGAAIEMKNIHGHSAFDFAKVSSDKEILKFLPLLQFKETFSPPSREFQET